MADDLSSLELSSINLPPTPTEPKPGICDRGHVQEPSEPSEPAIANQTARTVKQLEESAIADNPGGDKSSAAAFFKKFALDAPHWQTHDAPWHINARDFDQDMIQAVFHVNGAGNYYRLENGKRNDYAIVQQLRKLEGQSRDFKGDGELARNRLLDYWQLAKEIKEQRELAAQQVRAVAVPAIADYQPQPISEEEIEERRAQIKAIREMVNAVKGA